MGYRLILGDCLEQLKKLESNSVQCIVSSPPYYGLRDYGVDGQIGLEESPQAYITKLVEVFREARRVLKDDGTLWLNLGDSFASDMKGGGGSNQETMTISGSKSYIIDGQHYGARKFNHGLKPKDLMMIPARVAIALQDDGWWIRSEIIWYKPNPMPESVTDRPTKAHEMIYLLTKSARYFYDNEAVREAANNDSGFAKQRENCNSKKYPHPEGVVLGRKTDPHGGLTQSGNEPTRNLRSVWNIATRPFSEAHFATFPLEIPLRCIKAGTSERGECPHCGKAWVRAVEREKSDGPTWEQRKANGDKSGNRELNGVYLGEKSSPHLGTSIATTIGFTPQCQCPAHEPVHQTVLDPFNGAATTGVAALLLNRNYIGLELNPDYLEISRKRLQNYAIEMPDEIEQPKVIKTQLAMF